MISSSVECSMTRPSPLGGLVIVLMPSEVGRIETMSKAMPRVGSAGGVAAVVAGEACAAGGSRCGRGRLCQRAHFGKTKRNGCGEEKRSFPIRVLEHGPISFAGILVQCIVIRDRYSLAIGKERITPAHRETERAQSNTPGK